ncbi:MAG TPA: hypothetical protein PLO51_04245, partial [Candidatus Micrarchaeota archaeon]|nr:hypothetical protein [Candidatus Micrarchaeota archaeon]
MQKTTQPTNNATFGDGNKVNGNKNGIFPPAKVIENFKFDIQGGMDRIAQAKERSGVKGFVTVFGSARPLPSDSNYDLAADTSYIFGKNGYGTITGGGPGIMKAGNE